MFINIFKGDNYLIKLFYNKYRFINNIYNEKIKRLG